MIMETLQKVPQFAGLLGYSENWNKWKHFVNGLYGKYYAFIYYTNIWVYSHLMLYVPVTPADSFF